MSAVSAGPSGKLVLRPKKSITCPLPWSPTSPIISPWSNTS